MLRDELDDSELVVSFRARVSFRLAKRASVVMTRMPFRGDVTGMGAAVWPDMLESRQRKIYLGVSACDIKKKLYAMLA